MLSDARRSPPNVVSTSGGSPDNRGRWKEDYSPFAHLASPLAAKFIYLGAAYADIDSFSNMYMEHSRFLMTTQPAGNSPGTSMFSI